jgi:hypothetical protein
MIIKQHCLKATISQINNLMEHIANITIQVSRPFGWVGDLQLAMN